MVDKKYILRARDRVMLPVSRDTHMCIKIYAESRNISIFAATQELIGIAFKLLLEQRRI